MKKQKKLKANSWNLIPKPKDYSSYKLEDINNFLFDNNKKYLAHGMGRSYGDVCLNNGEIIFTKNFKKILDFDSKNGFLICESGITINELLNYLTPKGWFLPVVPGTSFVTIGGAIANDIHGKNHHNVGSFGNFVEEIEILTSTDSILKCSRNENPNLFYATIGGLGLTGLIVSAKIRLKEIESQFIETSTKRFFSFDEYLELNNLFSSKYEYTVSWVDFQFHKKNNKVRGVYIYGNHMKSKMKKEKKIYNFNINFPFKLPFSLVNNFTLRILNEIYFFLNKNNELKIQHYRSFFFPLDSIRNWNRAYGTKGFFQYQFVISDDKAKEVLKEIYNSLKSYNQRVCLGVLKTFGSIKSEGLLSFPQKGVTLAIDIQNKGKKTLDLLNELDSIVIKNGGRIYPAKDARMSKESFNLSFDNINNFSNYIDPKFNSLFKERNF